MTEAGPFLDVIGFPKEGEHVPPTGRAEAILIRQGWTKPEEGRCGHHGTGVRCQRGYRHDGPHGRAGIFWDDDGALQRWAS